jgi:hypothetical protein
MKQIFILLIIIALHSCGNSSHKQTFNENKNKIDTVDYTMLTIYKYIHEYDNKKLTKTTNIMSVFYSGQLSEVDTSYTDCTYDMCGVLIQDEIYNLTNGRKTIFSINRYYKNYQIEYELNGVDTIGIHKEWYLNNKIIKDFRKRKSTENIPTIKDSTFYFYDSNNHLLQQITHDLISDKVNTFYETFDSTRNKRTIIRKNDANKIVETTTVKYDDSGNKIFKTDEVPNLTLDSTIYTNNKKTCIISITPQRKKYSFIKYNSNGDIIEIHEYIKNK